MYTGDDGKARWEPIDLQKNPEWLAGMELYLLNVVRMARLVTPYLVAAGGGAIVNVSTAGALEPSPRNQDSRTSRSPRHSTSATRPSGIGTASMSKSRETSMSGGLCSRPMTSPTARGATPSQRQRCRHRPIQSPPIATVASEATGIRPTVTDAPGSAAVIRAIASSTSTPAAITGMVQASRPSGIASTLRDHGRTASPNAGWPMSTMAGLLGTRLEKPGHYVLGAELPPPDVPAIDHAAEIVKAATALALPVVLGVHRLVRPLTPRPGGAR